MNKYTYKQLKENLNKLTDEQLNQEVLTIEKHDYGFFINNIDAIFNVADGDPVQFDTDFKEGTVLLHITRKILH
jgi:hypothetical protein